MIQMGLGKVNSFVVLEEPADRFDPVSGTRCLCCIQLRNRERVGFIAFSFGTI